MRPTLATTHRDYPDAHRAANEGLRRAAIDMGMNPSDLDRFGPVCDHIVGDMTQLLLRANDRKSGRKA